MAWADHSVSFERASWLRPDSQEDAIPALKALGLTNYAIQGIPRTCGSSREEEETAGEELPFYVKDKAETNQWLRSKARQMGGQPSQSMLRGALGAGFRGCYQSHGLQRLVNWGFKVSGMGPSPHDASPRW